MKRTLSRLASVSLLTLAANAMAEPEYVTIAMEIDVDKPAAEVWEKVGEYCDIGEWANLECEIISGDGGMGTVRSLAGGRILEILVAQTELSYGYAQPVVEGQFYDQYHGFVEARPVTDTTSKLLYTLMLDVSNLENQEAKNADVARRRTMFEGVLVNMKNIAEGQ